MVEKRNNTFLRTVLLQLLLLHTCRPAFVFRRRQVVSGMLLLPWLRPNESTAAADLSQMLKPASPDQPQIPLPLPTTQNSVTTIEALLYYKNPRSDSRPLATDYFLITATNQPKGPVLAAARIPVGKVALPLRFTLTEANAIDREQFRQVLQEKDVWLQVQVCAIPSSDNDTTIRGDRLACPSSSTMLTAQGVAKLIQLQDQSSSIRAPASLALE